MKPVAPLSLASILVLGLAAPSRATFQAAPAAQAQAPAPIDLGGDIDDALRWLRYAQDRETGSYAKSVDATALVLRAMIESPRRYTRIDGPFVERALDHLVSRQAADGSIADAGATDKETIKRSTRLAAAALALHVDVKTQPALTKALAFVGTQAGDAAPWNDEPLPDNPDALRALVQNLLAARGKDGSWNGPKGPVLETAQRTMTLIRAWARLKPAEVAKPKSDAKPLPKIEPADRAQAAAAIERGASFLVGLADRGRFGEKGKPDAGLTAMAINGLLCVPEPRPKPIQDTIDQGLAWLVSLQRPDGSIHDGSFANYCTSAAILALVRAQKPEHKAVIEKARNFLIVLQADEGEGYSPSHVYYGGNSYGDEQRPDLSNVQMALEALSASGLEKDDQAFKRALKFLERCQNRSESNDIRIQDGDKTIVSGDDGGGTYTPGSSKAGFIEVGGKKIARSYGSMSYALLRGYVFCGLPKTDPRMQACWEWVRKNYTLDVNPGFEGASEPTAAYQGLFYYFHTMAKALDLYGEETVVDAQGKPHAWRKELAGRLVAMQRKTDGSWVNENSPRWWEGNPLLATSYALVTLSTALPAQR